MNSQNKYFAEVVFKNKIFEKNWNSFEDFFTLIMQKKDPRFIQVKPQWSKWDRKNDGFIKEEWIYYQVYSPEAPLKSIASWAEKAINDFDWLYLYWDKICKIKKYFFVFNDKFNWVYPDILEALLTLEKKYKEVEFNIFTSSNLKDIFLSLKESDIYSIVWCIPEINNIALDVSALSSVIEHLLNGKTESYEDRLYVPDFEDKIKFNLLSDKVKNILTKGWYEIWILEDYFNHTWNKNIRACIKDILKWYYNNWKEKWYVWDDLFFYILTSCKENIDSDSNAISSSIIVLLSYYFESCDIFEEPK